MNLLRSLVRNSLSFKQSFRRNILSYYEENTHYSKPWLNKLAYSTNTSDDIELDAIEFNENEIQNVPEINKPMRNLLYRDSENDILKRLKESTCIQNVFDLIENIEFNPEEKHGWRVWVQSILVLSDLQRIFCEEYLDQLRDYASCPEKVIANYLQSVNTHKSFQRVVEIISKNVENLSPEELSCCSLFLFKMGVNINTPVMSSLLFTINEKLQDQTMLWDSDSLVRISKFFGINKNLQFTIISRHLIPHILNKIENCQTVDEFQKISEMLSNIHALVTIPIVIEYKQKLNNLLENTMFKDCQPVVIFKIMSLLNYPFWLSINNKEFEKLFHEITDKIKNMDADELVFLFKMFKQFHEPAIILKLITERASHLLEVHKNEDTMSSSLKLVDLFYCQFHSASPATKQKFESIFMDIISKTYSSKTLFYFKLARIMKNDNRTLSNMFWLKIMELLKDSSNDNYKLLKVCYKYMYFDNNSKRTYRNSLVENEIVRNLQHHIYNSEVRFIPWKFSRSISFLLAYSTDKKNQNFNIHLEDLVNELASMSSQLSSIDTLILSKGLNIFIKMKSRKSLTLSMGQVCLKLNNIIQNCANRFLNKDTLSLIELNALMKMYINRITHYDTMDFYNILRKYDECEFELCSKSIKDTVYCMYASGYVTTSFLDKLCHYVQTKNMSLIGDTVHKVLNILYNSGYNPENKLFLNCIADIIERDKEEMNSLCLLQICEGLCYFDRLPASLVQYVFSIEFMEHLDKEILSCYSKHTYPSRIRKQLMFLNRSVCIDMPEYNIPWFHEKYLQDVISLTPSFQSAFYKDVLENLKNILGDLSVIKCFHYTPYGYNVDFFFQIDKNGKPTLTDSLDNKKVAVMLLDKNSYYKFFETANQPDGNKTFSITTNKRGSVQLIMRHLELLNYIVIEVSTFTWHSLHMSEKNAKFNYINQQLLNRNIHLQSN